MKPTIPYDRLTVWEKWQYADFTHPFIFPEILRRNPDLTKQIIQMAAPDLKINQIELVEAEVRQPAVTYARTGRLDVKVTLDNGRLVLIELQMRKQKFFAYRVRYYQSEADVTSLPKGAPYDGLPNIIQISFCDFDPVGAGKYVYDFANRDRENPEIVLGDGTRKIFLNTKGYRGNVTKQQKEFLRYLSGAETDDELCGEIHDRIEDLKYNERVQGAFMKFEDYLREEKEASFDEGLEKGRAEGLEKGRAEGLEKGADAKLKEMVRKKLAKGLSVEAIAEALEESEDKIRELIEELSTSN